MFTGTYTAIVTPFQNGRIDEAALAKLIKSQIKGGVEGIVPVGTTGESPTLDHEEHLKVIELAVKFAAGRVKVIAGTGANSTAEAIDSISGRGLGLGLVRSELEGLGGTVGMTSIPGHGARFVLHLPATAVATPAARGRAAA